MVGLLRFERLRRRPRHRVQRHPQRGRAHRCLAALQVPPRRARCRLAWSTGSSPATRQRSRPVVSSTRPGATSTAGSSMTALHRLDDELRWTAADPQLRWLRLNAPGSMSHRRRDRRPRRAGAPGPARARCPGGGDRSRSPTCATSAGAHSPDRRRRHRCQPHRLHRRPGLRAVDPGRARRRPVWDALMEAGRPYGFRPAGMLALDVAARGRPHPARGRLHLGAPRDDPEQNYSPFELGLGGWSSSTRATSSGACARREQHAGGPPRRLVGLQLDWYDIEALFSAHGACRRPSSGGRSRRRSRSTRGGSPGRPGSPAMAGARS